MRQETDYSLGEIGQELGDRSPATVSHAYQKIAGNISNSPSLRRKLFEIQQAIESSPKNGHPL
jgi:chromosomal replication initiator protein